MIVDHIRNRDKYYYLGKDYKIALDFFAGVSVDSLDKEDVALGDCDVIVKVRPMQTKIQEECTFEAHRRYADIHFVAYGIERIGYCDVSKLELEEYNEEKDVAILRGDGDLITLLPGYFMITLPDDAHMPCVCVGEAAPLGKMIAKIKL